MKFNNPVIVTFFVLIFDIYFSAAQFSNVMIENSFSPEEPSIAINPLNTNHLAAGTNMENYYYSTDGGSTWTWNIMNSTLGEGGDPCLIADSLGNFFYLHLSDGYDRIVCQRSIDSGMTYDNGSFAWNNNTMLQDKEWASVDMHNNTIYAAWSQYENGFNPGPTDSSDIYFSKSTDQGASFSVPIRLNAFSGDCLYNDITDPHPFPGADGQVYLTFMDSTGLRFTKSLDSGNTWMPLPLLIDSNGIYRYYSIQNVLRLRAMPYSVCDRSTSIYRGNIYVSWADDRNGVNNTDVFFIRSTDGGNTWSAAQKINKDTTSRYQYRNAMTVDQTNGYIYVVNYDRRNYAGNNDTTDVYLSKSMDGGVTWTEYKISSSYFLADGSVFDGDYIDITAHAGIVRPIWTRVDSSMTSVWTCLYNENTVGIASIENESDKNSFRIYPNPAGQFTWLSFLFFQNNLEVQIFDSAGRLVKSDFIKNDKDKLIQLNELKPGIYFVKAGLEVRKLIKGQY